MLTFKDMDESSGKNRAHHTGAKKTYDPLNPRAASKKKFTSSQIKRVNDFVKNFALPHTLKFLSETQFGNDPLFVEAALKALERAESVLGAQGGPGLKFQSMGVETEEDSRHQVQEMLESELYEARSTWISEHKRGIENESHPLDRLESWNPDLSEGGGQDD